MNRTAIDFDLAIGGLLTGLISDNLRNEIRELVEEINKENKENGRNITVKKSYIDHLKKKLVVELTDNEIDTERLLDL